MTASVILGTDGADRLAVESSEAFRFWRKHWLPVGRETVSPRRAQAAARPGLGRLPQDQELCVLPGPRQPPRRSSGGRVLPPAPVFWLDFSGNTVTATGVFLELHIEIRIGDLT